jgi:hypothetical protein
LGLLRERYRIKPVLRLFIIQLGAFITIWLSSYFSGLDIILALLFLVIILSEAGSVSRDTRFRAEVIAIIWQLPGILLSLLIVTRISDGFYLGQYLIFLLEFWYTPVLPLISILNSLFLPTPAYYYMLIYTPFFLIFFYIAAAHIINRKN